MRQPTKGSLETAAKDLHGRGGRKREEAEGPAGLRRRRARLSGGWVVAATCRARAGCAGPGGAGGTLPGRHRGAGRGAAMSEAAAGMAAAMMEARLRRKQLLSAEEAELFELAQAAGSGLDPEVFR